MMEESSSVYFCDGNLLKQWILAGLQWLETNQEIVNRLNVFPVPDGDTGTNMFLTMKKACDALADMDEPHVGKLSEMIANGALFGARGNSGVILSQWWRGFAEALASHESFDAVLFGQACKNAVERSYKAVMKPMEGTILTVTRQAMEAVVGQAHSGMDLCSLLTVKTEAAYAALKQTPDLLPLLKEAGVVDSGGQGFTFIIEGMLRHMRGEVVRMEMEETTTDQSSWQEALRPEDEEGYGYDVQFLMHGRDMDVDAVRESIAAIGWSTLVVGDANLIKVHVHVHDPGVPISYAIAQGASLDDVVVENMQRQYETYVIDRAKRDGLDANPNTPVDGAAVIAVAAGEGFEQLFRRDLGAALVITGGQTMNPSTESFIKAIQTLPNTYIILLPNNPNVLLTARQAASLVTDKAVRVVNSRSIPQGIAAMIEYNNVRDDFAVNELAEAMNQALPQVVTCEITTATRSVAIEGVQVREGQFIGLVNDALSAAGDTLGETVKTTLRKADADKHELITLYYGDLVQYTEAQSLVNELRQVFPDQELQIVNGGQPLYPYIISVE